MSNTRLVGGVVFLIRTLGACIAKVNDFFPVVLITGPRQVGKTSLLEECAKENRKYVSLDSFEKRSLAQNDPALFLQKYKPPVLIDEIQYAPQLFPYIKEIVDREKQKGLFWITGSQQFSLMQNVSESLAGRVGILHLQGFSQAEKFNNGQQTAFLPKMQNIENKKINCVNAATIFHTIWKGSYPSLWLNSDEHWELFYSSYVETYIQRDVKQILNISNELTFMKFMRAAAAQTGQLLDYASMARDVSVAETTIKSWISVLNTSGIIFLLQPYSNNLTKRALKTPKLYFMDTGLACFLTRWNNFEALEEGAYSGAIFETYVISEILKSYWHNGKEPFVYFYRDKEKREIDLLIDLNGKLYPIEIKKKANPDKNDIRHFHLIEDTLKQQQGEGCVVCLSEECLPISSNVYSVPVGMI